MSFRSFFIVVLLAIFSFAFGWLLFHSSIAFLPALLFAGFILFCFQQFFLKELMWFTWAELWSRVRPLDFFFMALGFLAFLPTMPSQFMPIGLIVFMRLVVFALIFLSAYWIFYEDR